MLKWHSVNWPYTMTTTYWSDFVPNSTFTEFWVVSIEHLRRVWHADRGRLLLSDTWSCPFGTCICSTCWDQSFSELVIIFPDYALRISLGTFSILHQYNPAIVLKTKRRRSDPVLWQKPLYQQKCQRGKVATQTTPQKSSIKQKIADRLRTVSWSNYSHPTGVVNRFTGPPSHSPQQPCNQKYTHLKICK